MSNRHRLSLVNDIAPGIQVYGIKGSNQFVVATTGNEYSFTREEDARKFAQELAQKRETFKTASLARPEAPLPTKVPTQKKGPKRFQFGL